MFDLKTNEPPKYEPLSPLDLKTEQGKRLVAFAELQMRNGENRAFELERMAEGYALQGEYQKAFETAQDEQRKQYYGQIVSAINAKECSCSGKPSPKFVTDQFYHQGNILSLWKCVKCSCMWTKC